MRLIMLLCVALTVAASAQAQKLQVKVVERQNIETEYTYVVAGQSYSNSNLNVNCNGSDSNVNCNGSGNTTTTSIPAQRGSYRVRGATFTLQLPDGRIAVVNCESKFAEHMAGAAGNHRNCRVPLVDDIEAEFHGDKAKLKWNVSIDGKKSATETYKILAVFPK
jgi:hypothetical protein